MLLEMASIVNPGLEHPPGTLGREVPLIAHLGTQDLGHHRKSIMLLQDAWACNSSNMSFQLLMLPRGLWETSITSPKSLRNQERSSLPEASPNCSLSNMRPLITSGNARTWSLETWPALERLLVSLFLSWNSWERTRLWETVKSRLWFLLLPESLPFRSQRNLTPRNITKMNTTSSQSMEVSLLMIRLISSGRE